MVNRATFYDHFVDKYALLQYSIRAWFRDTLEKQPPSTDGVNEDLKGLMVTTCEFLAKLRYHCLPRDNAVLPLVQTTITDLIAETLLQWLNRVNDSKTSDPNLIAAGTSWAIYSAAFYWSQLEDREPVDRFAQQVLPTIQASLAHQPVAIPQTGKGE